MKKFKLSKKNLNFRNEKGGGSGFLLVLLFFFITTGIFLTFLKLVTGQHNLSKDHRDQAIAIHLADSAADQVLSKIRNHIITLPLEYVPPPTQTPTLQGTLPMTVSVAVGVDAYVTTAYARIDFDRNTANVVERDIEGNVRFTIQTSVTNATATGGKSKLSIRRGVKAIFIMVNFAKYLGFVFANDDKTLAEYNGPYHVNGNATFNGNCDWNDATLNFRSGTPANPFYDATYVSVVSGSFINGGSMNYKSQASVACPVSPTGSTLPNAACPQGTWIDGAHGGVVVPPVTVDATLFSSLGNAVLDASILSNGQLFVRQGPTLANTGTITISGSNQLIDCGVSNPAPVYNPVRVNLNALNHGITCSGNTGVFGEYKAGDGYLGTSDAQAQSNYDACMATDFGVVIFVKGDAAVWGKVPNASTTLLDYNKRVTVIATGSVQIMGDVLVSSSPYTSGTLLSKTISVNPLTDNPHDDSIAILSANGNIYVNPYLDDQDAFYVNPGGSDGCGGDERIDAFLYAPNGVTGGASGTPGAGAARGYQTYKSGGQTAMSTFTFHGAISVLGSGYLPSTCSGGGYSRFYDPRMKYNISPIIPAGTVVFSWQDEVNPLKLP